MAHLQAFQAIEPVDSLVIDQPTLPLQQRMYPPVAIAHPDGGNLFDPFPQRGLLSSAGPVVEGGAGGG